MPAFDASTPLIDVTILQHPLKGPAPFTPGHVLTEPEAKQLNRWTVTAVANGIPAYFKRMRAEAEKAGTPFTDPDAATIQSTFNSRYAEFELGQSNRGSTPGQPADPVARFVRAMAVEYLNSRLKAKGKNIQTVRAAKDPNGNSIYEALLADAISRNPQWTELAQMQVDAIGEAAEDDFDIGTVGDKAEAAPEPEAEQPVE